MSIRIQLDETNEGEAHMKTVAFCTLGCKVNQYETEAMITLFKDKGYEIKSFDDICDIYVINTCTVTLTGERKSRQMIGRAHKKNPDALIAVVGCYSQVAPEKVKKLAGVSLVIGTKERANIVELTEEAMRSKEPQVKVNDIMKERTYEELWISTYEDKTRAFVKIEEGCTEFCSYCIIPYARGPVRSRSEESITKEVTALAQNGYKEIVLTGIHIGSYGKDLGGKTLLDAIKAAACVDGIERIRLGSVEPRVLTDEFVREICKMDKICDHFHVSLQSGCDSTLRRMNRKYSTDEYQAAIARLRAAFPNPAITTDIITGFPGETEADFHSSLEFMKKIAFSEVHVFPYSPREGTKAAMMDNQVPKQVREERARIMIAEAQKLHQEYLGSFVGKRREVLFEREVASGEYEGHMTNYIKVRVKYDKNLAHKIENVTLTGFDKSTMIGEI